MSRENSKKSDFFLVWLLSLYSFKYGTFFIIVVKSGHVFDNVQRAVLFDQKIRGVDGMPSIASKETLDEKLQKALIELLPENKINATSGSTFAEEIEQLKKTHGELELLKNVDCFLDAYGG